MLDTSSNWSVPVKSKSVFLHPGRFELLVAGKRANPSVNEFKILELLMRKPFWVFSRQQIISGIRGEGYPVTDRAVDVAVVGIRREMGSLRKLLETVPGVGYRFAEQTVQVTEEDLAIPRINQISSSNK